MSVTILEGDCRAVLPQRPAASVQCVVTSPPYWGLRDYGVAGQIGLEPTPEAWLGTMVDVFREVRRVLRDDGTLWVNVGDGYTSGDFTRQGKPRNVPQLPNDWEGTALGNRGRAGHAVAIKRDLGHLKPKNLVGQPWRLALALQADGWYLRADIIWHKPNPMPESVTDRPPKAHEYVFLLTKSARYYYDADAVRERIGEFTRRQRTFRGGCYTNNATFNNSHDYTGHEPYSDGDPSLEGRNLRSVWTIPTAAYDGCHFATFPPELARRCIVAGSRMGDTILDPFAGSGTVGEVAEQNGRDSILIELSPAYCRQMRERTAQRGLFASADSAHGSTP